jgi:hypothetical protein
MAWVPVEVVNGVYYHRPDKDMVELIFRDLNTAVWINKKTTKADFWVIIKHSPIAVFFVEDNDVIEYWTDFYRLKADYADSNGRAMFRAILIDLLRPLRPYKEVK